MHLHEAVAHPGACLVAGLPVGRHGGDEGDDAVPGEQVGHPGDAAHVHVAVLAREAEAGAEVLTNVVAVEHLHAVAGVAELARREAAHRGLARARQPREPEAHAGAAAGGRGERAVGDRAEIRLAAMKVEREERREQPMLRPVVVGRTRAQQAELLGANEPAARSAHANATDRRPRPRRARHRDSARSHPAPHRCRRRPRTDAPTRQPRPPRGSSRSPPRRWDATAPHTPASPGSDTPE